MTQTGPSPETLELMNSEIKGMIDAQILSASKVDTKATIILTILGLSVPAGLWRDWSWYYLGSKGFLIAAAVMALRCVFVRSRPAAPSPMALTKYEHSSKVELLGSLIGTRTQVYEENLVIFKRKADSWRVSALLAGTSFATALAGSSVEAWLRR